MKTDCKMDSSVNHKLYILFITLASGLIKFISLKKKVHIFFMNNKIYGKNNKNNSNVN